MLQKLKSFFSLVYARLKSDSPAFFRKLGNFFTGLFVLCVTAQEPVADFVSSVLHLGVVPEGWLSELTRYVGFGAAIGKVVTLLTVDPRKVSERKYEQINPGVDSPPTPDVEHPAI